MQVVGFYPHAMSAGVFGMNPSTLFPIVGSFEGGAQHNEQGNRTIMLYHSHLAIEVYNFKFRRSPSIQKAELGALCTPKSDKADSSPEAKNIFKDLRPLEQRPALALS